MGKKNPQTDAQSVDFSECERYVIRKSGLFLSGNRNGRSLPEQQW